MGDSDASKELNSAAVGDDDFYRILEKRLEQGALESIKSADMKYVENLASKLADQANEEKKRVTERRKKSFLRKAGADLSMLADSSQKFLSSYKDIKSVATGIDQQLGPMVYGVVAVLITVGSNKKIHDDLTAEMLSKFNKWLKHLPRVLDLGQHHPEIQSHIIEIYHPIILFLRRTILYYTRSSRHRLLQALTRSPKEYLQQESVLVTERITHLIQELTITQCEYMLRMHRSHDEGENDAHQSQLREIAEAFGVSQEDLSADQMETICKDLYGRTSKFPTTGRKGGRPKPFTLERATLEALTRRKSYQSWDQHESSCLLILGGNNFSPGPTHECWLSPLGLQFWAEMQSKSTARIALCSMLALNEAQSRIPVKQQLPLAQQAMKAIIWQLLVRDKRLCRRLFSHISRNQYIVQRKDASEQNSHPTQDLDPDFGPWDRRTEALFKLLGTVLSAMPERTTVYIVIDGVDKLLYHGESGPEDFFQSLLSICLDPTKPESRSIVKIMAICSERRWPHLQQDDSFENQLRHKLGLQRFLMTHVFPDLYWNQGSF